MIEYGPVTRQSQRPRSRLLFRSNLVTDGALFRRHRRPIATAVDPGWHPPEGGMFHTVRNKGFLVASFPELAAVVIDDPVRGDPALLHTSRLLPSRSVP